MGEPSGIKEVYQELDELDNETHNADISDTKEKKENLNPASQYAYLYKSTDLYNTQDKRRKVLLEIQKQNRNKIHDENRCISEFVESDDDVDYEMDTDAALDLVQTTINYSKRLKSSYTKHMFSEWLTEVPKDLESEWVIKLCPIGVRNMIVANNFRTRAYKGGKLVSEFASNLPAGRPYSNEKDSITVLDGIYNHKLKCIFVLDILVWKNCSLRKSPASLRFFWLKSRLSEIDVQEITDTNEFRIVEVPEYPAELSVIEDKLAHPYRDGDEIVPLDGILFYHKETWYKSGRTPLVGWLKPYMVPEKLHIPVCEYFMHKTPDNYVSLQHYLLNSKSKADVIMKVGCDTGEDRME